LFKLWKKASIKRGFKGTPGLRKLIQEHCYSKPFVDDLCIADLHEFIFNCNGGQSCEDKDPPLVLGVKIREFNAEGSEPQPVSFVEFKDAENIVYEMAKKLGLTSINIKLYPCVYFSI